MQKGESRNTNLVLRLIKDRQVPIKNFITRVMREPFYSFQREEEVNHLFSTSTMDFLHHLSEEELLDLRQYTGYQYKQLNALLRNNWSYEEHGLLSDEQKDKYEQLSESIRHILDKYISPEINFITYRGVSLSAFSKYGITSLSDLEYMKGKYMYEEGFTSTSILQKTSYFNQHLETGIDYNIEIQYFISKNTREGALLSSENMSYSPSQNEYLLNAGSLTKIVDVEIKKETNQATLKAIVVPKKVWDLTYVDQVEDVKDHQR